MPNLETFDLMNSPEGYILRFCKKIKDGMFETMNPHKYDTHVARARYCVDGVPQVARLRLILSQRGTVRMEEFDEAMKNLKSEGFIADDDTLTDAGQKFTMEAIAFIEAKHAEKFTGAVEK